MSSARAARIAATFGVDPALVPSDDAEPEELLRAADVIGRAITTRSAPRSEPPWEPLPTRAVAERTADQRRATVAAVIAWAERGGAPLHGVAARVDAAGNVEMYATRDIISGDLIFALPRRLMIVDSEVAPGEPTPHPALAAWLAVAVHDPASPWRAYLDDLPPHLAELPLFRATTELAALAGTTAHAHAVADRSDLLDAKASHHLPLADFAWGWAIVRSRAYHAPGSFEPHLALMPIVDLFDHGHGDTTWTYDHVDAMFAITAQRAISAGEPVTFPYGDFGNGRLLAHYGFTLPDDPFADALLVFESPTDPAAEIAAHLLWQLPLAHPARIPVACRVDHRFARALSVARLYTATAADRARAAELGLTPTGDLPWLGSTVEDRALALLAGAALRGIARLDADAPRTGDRDWDASAARVRAGERAVLAQYSTLANGDGPLHRDYRSALDAPPRSEPI